MTTNPQARTLERDSSDTPTGGVHREIAPYPDATRAPNHAQLLVDHTAVLEGMAEEAEARAVEADMRARAWQDVAETHDRLARGYRKALDYLAQRAAEDVAPGPGERDEER